MKRWSICLVALVTLGIVSTASADPIKDPLPWVGPQILSAINKHNVNFYSFSRTVRDSLGLGVCGMRFFQNYVSF